MSPDDQQSDLAMLSERDDLSEAPINKIQSDVPYDDEDAFWYQGEDPNKNK